MATSSTTSVNGIIGGWAVSGGTDFTKANGAGTAIGGGIGILLAWQRSRRRRD